MVVRADGPAACTPKSTGLLFCSPPLPHARGTLSHRPTRPTPTQQTPIGLMVPIVRDADQKGLAQIAAEVKALAAKVGAGVRKRSRFGAVAASEHGLSWPAVRGVWGGVLAV